MPHHTIYSDPCPFFGLNLKHEGFINQKLVSFPKHLSRTDLILASTEKGLLKWVLHKRALKTIKILLGANPLTFH